MPWKSKAQAAWGHTEAGEKALGGDEAVAEWDKATKGKKLPKTAKHPKHEMHDMAEHISRVNSR